MTADHGNTPIPPLVPATERRAAAEALEADRKAGLERVARLREELDTDPTRVERHRLGLPPTEAEVAYARLLNDAEAKALRSDETIPGGRYVDARGRVVDSFGRPLDEPSP